jgi:hypothetical protein
MALDGLNLMKVILHQMAINPFMIHFNIKTKINFKVYQYKDIIVLMTGVGMFMK